ncbi:hypothetical protein V1477_011295 [Vespula maculifrons]|uniref:Uncharacterized protein n=1 Tax=Vespula maculifrons TaxID=7453 RepID=A0ABD2C4D4_VESMC
MAYDIRETLYGDLKDRYIILIKTYSTTRKIFDERPTKSIEVSTLIRRITLKEEQSWNAVRCLFPSQKAKQFESPATTTKESTVMFYGKKCCTPWKLPTRIDVMRFPFKADPVLRPSFKTENTESFEVIVGEKQSIGFWRNSLTRDP